MLEPTFIEATIGALAGSMFEQPIDPIASGIAAETSTPGPDVFWQQNYPLKDRGRRRWKKRPRPIEQVTAIGVHHTGIRGGFGVASYQVSQWLRAWDAALRRHELQVGDPPEEHRDKPVVWKRSGLSPDIARKGWAELQALRTRYLGLPYHSISSPADELVMNHKATTYTHHGDRMNGWTWGHAIDDYWDEDSATGDAVESEIGKLARVYKHLHDQGAGLELLEFHFQYAAKPFDPPRIYVEAVAMPFARMHKLKIRMDHKVGGGKTVREVLR